MASAEKSPDPSIPGKYMDSFDLDPAQTFPLLQLPREIRKTILGELFFPGEIEADEFEQDTLGLDVTGVRQIFPYATDEQRKPHFDVSILRAILQITTLKEFDIPVIHGGVIYDFPEFKDDFLPWLKSGLLQQPQHGAPLQKQKLNENHEGTKVSFLEFPREIRDLVYRQVLLPWDRRIHPYIRSWYDQDTRNAVSLFLVDKQIHHEAELVLYSEGIFTAASLQHQTNLLNMLREKTKHRVKDIPDYKRIRLPQRSTKLIRHIRLALDFDRAPYETLSNINNFVEGPLITFAAKHMQLSSLTIVLSDSLVRHMNRQWVACAPNEIPKWRGGFSEFLLRYKARLPVRVETLGIIQLDAFCLEWLTEGLKRERLFRIDMSPSMDWLYTR
ncbi:hypothetical protein MMC17_008169 [Xylographa soralifera]|nr:hypothetical protein [Xylographa soralifera]